MKITDITIIKLFGLFDYNINLNTEEGLTILTGPNGYGKTTILNILNNLFAQNFFYFQKLKFERIILSLDDNYMITISKEKVENSPEERIVETHSLFEEPESYGPTRTPTKEYVFDENIIISVFQGEFLKDFHRFNINADRRFYREIESHPEVGVIRSSKDGTRKILTLGNGVMTFGEFLTYYYDTLPRGLNEILNDNKLEIGPLSDIFNELQVYLIREQRLFKHSTTQSRFSKHRISIINTIEESADELKELIKQTQLKALEETQRLDSSFPQRLLRQKDKLTEKQFELRFTALIEKQKQLQKFGITVSQQDMAEYSSDNANVLTVYLTDSEHKLDIYNDLLSKLNLFVDIINQKEFVNKEIHIDSVNGFSFVSADGHIISLSDLSSGEQHEVVLLYELLFKAEPNTLILIDEPEISLHVIWQKAFVKDLQSIAKVKNISFLIATHSPQIINSRWELTRDLFELAQKD